MRRCVCLSMAWLVSTSLFASDWPQWRGPQRTGATDKGPALAAAWPTEGLTKLWQSEPIPGGGKFGWGSPVIAGNRVYLFVSGANGANPICKLTNNDLDILRGRLSDKTALTKLAPIKDEKFATQADLDKWFADSGIDPALQKSVHDLIAATRDYAKDTIVCLDLGSGRMLWKKVFANRMNDRGGSTTPCVAGGKVYACGLGGIYCLDASDGKEIWTNPRGCVNSSFLVVGGVAALQGGPVRAFDADTGKLLWTQSAAGGEHNSLTAWETGGTTYLLANGRNLSALDIKTGQIAWTVPGGSTSTPVVSGDFAVVQAEKSLLCYKLTPAKAEQVWTVPVGIESGSPVIYKGHVYVSVGGLTLCIELDTGKTNWKEKPGRSDYASPIVADGKLLVATEGGAGVAMVDTNPDRFTLLGKAKVGMLECTTPTVADGKLVVRTSTCLVAYDLVTGLVRR
jgi:outer membrane protein assembly factor BamB